MNTVRTAIRNKRPVGGSATVSASGGTKQGFANTHPQWWLKKGDDIRDIQTLLKEAGYDPGTIDGVYGQKSLDAVRDFQKAHGLSSEFGNNFGVPGPSTMSKLLEVTKIIVKADPPEAEQNKAPKPADEKRWRLHTGVFQNAKALNAGIERLEKEVGWLLYERADSTQFNPTYRIYTGTFTGKNVAEYHAQRIGDLTNWTIYVMEA